MINSLRGVMVVAVSSGRTLDFPRHRSENAKRIVVWPFLSVRGGDGGCWGILDGMSDDLDLAETLCSVPLA